MAHSLWRDMLEEVQQIIRISLRPFGGACFRLRELLLNMSPPSRDVTRPSFAKQDAHKRGRRECRVLAAPAASRAK
jgi:hypothetical protein